VRGEKKAESMEEKQEYLVSGLPGINIVRAKTLLKHFKSPAAVFSASEEDLQKVGGIGGKLAAGMKEALESKYKGKKQV
jgi:ERCC4-type nuclease